MNTKNKIIFELTLKEIITNEKTTAATDLKYNLILDLINKQIDYIGVINYYYDIINLNQQQDK